MKRRRGRASPSETAATAGRGAKSSTEVGQTESPKHSRRWRHWGIFLLVLVVVLAVGRALLPWTVRNYVNRTLDRNPLYAGRIGEVQIHLWRGAYSIHDVRISKTTGNVPVPLFSARRVDFAVQWDALFHGKIVGRILIDQPQLNFVDAPSEGQAQTGAGGPWLQMVRDLFPFRINSALVQQGSIHFRAFQAAKPVDVYLSHLEAAVDNLTNIRDETTPLISTVQATALAMDQAKFEYKMTLDPFSYRPTFHLAMRLLGLEVTRINDLALSYGKFDFKHGWFDLVLEADAKEGQLRGYVKPLFRNLRVFSLGEDLKEDTVLQFFWQALVGAATSIFKNQPHDQFGTLIPFRGDLSGAATADVLATLGNLLRNAFVRAYLPRLQSGQEGVDGLEFSPPELSDPMSAGDPSASWFWLSPLPCAGLRRIFRLRFRFRRTLQRSSLFNLFNSFNRFNFSRLLTLLLLSLTLSVLVGCGTGKTGKQRNSFFTSGSREADQRASQRMAKEEQLADTGGGTGEKDVKKAKPNAEGTEPAQAEGKLTLFDRLGGERGLTALVDDFTQRLLQDPRVNWERKGVKRGGFSFHRNQSVSWNPTPQNIANLKKHMAEFLALATGGPAHYTGKEIQATHADMHISNPEFDAAIGDIKASLDRLRIPDKEQKELLAIIESTRPQIVTER